MRQVCRVREECYRDGKHRQRGRKVRRNYQQAETKLEAEATANKGPAAAGIRRMQELTGRTGKTERTRDGRRKKGIMKYESGNGEQRVGEGKSVEQGGEGGSKRKTRER